MTLMTLFWVWLILGGALAFCILMMFRNNWVFKKRTELLWEDMEKYDRLLSYDAMMWRFWVWNIEKLIKP